MLSNEKPLFPGLQPASQRGKPGQRAFLPDPLSPVRRRALDVTLDSREFGDPDHSFGRDWQRGLSPDVAITTIRTRSMNTARATRPVLIVKRNLLDRSDRPRHYAMGTSSHATLPFDLDDELPRNTRYCGENAIGLRLTDG